MGRQNTASNQTVTTTTAGHAVATDPANSWSCLLWLKMPDASGGSNFDIVFAENDGTDDVLNLFAKTDGALDAVYRPGGPGQPSAVVNGTTLTNDDDAWHWSLTTWDGSSKTLELFIDRSSEGTNTNASVTQTYTENNLTIGRNAQNLPTNSIRARFMNFTSKLSIEDAETLARGRLVVQPNLWWELGWGDPEPDFSGNGLNGTVNNSMAVGDHPPTGPIFGFDLGWQGAFTAAGLPIPILSYHYNHHLGTMA